MQQAKRVLERLGFRILSAKSDLGQTTAEYALVLLGAAAVAFVLITWASGSDSGIKEFFQKIMNKLSNQVN